ncbi:MAG: potassium-transporting ATPase subunit KdpB [Chloroflexi bacterium]|nr:potassium-transporting ATPase subunit KdpB [Chloroflexota bacterium]
MDHRQPTTSGASEQEPIAPARRPSTSRPMTPAAGERRQARAGGQPARSLWQGAIVRQAAVDSFKKLNPITMLSNPVMFIVEVGSVITTLVLVLALVGVRPEPAGFVFAVTVWLWLTVLFANFAEAMAEGRGKAQAATLRRTRTTTTAKVLRRGNGQMEDDPSSAAYRALDRTAWTATPAPELRRGDLVLIEAGDTVPGDGAVVAGVAYVNEAAITGESAPVVKEPGTDNHSTVTGGTEVTSDWLIVQISSNPGETFLDRMIALVEGAVRQKTPNEIALTILLAGLTIIFLLATVTLQPFAIYAGQPLSIVVLIALLVCLIPTTIGGLLSAIGIAGMDRLVQRNVLAMSGRAVEAAGDVDTLLLDKTGTITYGSRLAHRFFPAPGVDEHVLAEAALVSSLADETPEGKSIVALAEQMGLRADRSALDGVEFIPFTAQTRMSGVRSQGTTIMKGAVDAITARVAEFPAELRLAADDIGRQGGTPLAVARDAQALGVIYLKDTVKPGIRERFEEMRRAGIRTVMVTGDNPLTAATIAHEAGVDDFVAEVKPEDKMRLIREEQAAGRLVAMTGDGTNDAPALAQADVGVAMNSGTAAAKEAGNMVDLDSDPTKLLDVVVIGKQLLMTRGALTTFSIANDVAKYFAIIPALFIGTAAAPGVYPELAALNIMGLASPQSAILSAVIFNALIIVVLVPLALRGVAYRPESAATILRRNLLIYGLGGIIAPFVGIKLIDLILVALRLV